MWTSANLHTFVVNKSQIADRLTTAAVTINGVEIYMLIDSGASVNVINNNSFQKLHATGVMLTHTRVRLFPYSSNTPLLAS